MYVGCLLVQCRSCDLSTLRAISSLYTNVLSAKKTFCNIQINVNIHVLQATARLTQCGRTGLFLSWTTFTADRQTPPADQRNQMRHGCSLLQVESHFTANKLCIHIAWREVKTRKDWQRIVDSLMLRKRWTKKGAISTALPLEAALSTVVLGFNHEALNAPGYQISGNVCLELLQFDKFSTRFRGGGGYNLFSRGKWTELQQVWVVCRPIIGIS